MAFKRYLKHLVSTLGYVPSVKSDNEFVDITVAEKDGKLLVNLINMTGAHNAVGTRSYSDIPVLSDVNLEIEIPEAPLSVRIEPGCIVPAHTYDGKKLKVKMDRLHIHSVIVIE